MRYHPHTTADVQQMLQAVGVAGIEELFASIPEPLRLTRPPDLPRGLAEPELMRLLGALAEQNRVPGKDFVSFLGAGLYAHHVPAVVAALAGRGEFLTAYTPYQAEVSQGTLQAIFEFQTMVAELLGVEVANASMYDGASATAEAALMALRLQRADGGTVVCSRGVHPQYREVLATYIDGMRITAVPCRNGITDPEELKQALATAGCRVAVVQQPSFFGCLEDVAALAQAAHEAGALLVVTTTEPTAFGVVEAPGRQGADVVCGEGQPLGLPVSLGGPGVGLFGCRNEHVRAMPGRLVGETVDSRGQRGYVLTLAAREQHIRREKATSNICTNHGLAGLMVSTYLSLLGRSGLEELARLNLSASAYLRSRAAELPGLSVPFSAPVFNELTLRLDGRDAAAVRDRLLGRGLLAGYPLGAEDPSLADALLVHVSELHSREEIDRLVEELSTGCCC